MARKSKRYGDISPDKNKEKKAENEAISSRARELQDSVIALSPELRTEIVDWLHPRIDEALVSQDYQDRKDRIQRMRRNYLEGVPRTEIPMPGAHDYRSREAATLTDGMKARLIGIFTSDPVIKMEGANRIGVRNAPKAERWLDYHHDVNVELPKAGDLTVTYVTIEGHAVYHFPWRVEIDPQYLVQIERRKYANAGQTRMVDVNSRIEVEKARNDGFKAVEPAEFEVEDVFREEIIKNHPDLQVKSLMDHLMPAFSKPDKKPAWEAIREEFTLQQLRNLEQEGKFYKGVTRKLKIHLKKQGALADSEEQDMERSDTEEVPPPAEKDSLDAVVNCWVIYGLLKVGGKDKLEEQVMVYHHESRTLMHAKWNTLPRKLRPIRHIRLIRAPWRFDGIGVMELAMHGERVTNDLVNYVLDETRIFSALTFIYKKKEFPDGLSPMDFWKGIGVKKNLNDIREANFKDRRPMDLNVNNVTRAHTEKRVGIGDLQLGRESDITGKTPPPATSVVAILREGNVRFNLLNFSLLNEITGFASDEMLMFQQLASRKTVTDAVDSDGKEVFPDGMSKHEIIGKYKYRPNVTAQSMVRELDAELNLFLYQTMREDIFIKQSLSSSYELTKNVFESFGKKKSPLKPIEFYQEAMGKPTEAEKKKNLTPEEQEFVGQMINDGKDQQEVEQRLEEFRRTGSKGEGSPLKTSGNGAGGEQELELIRQILTGVGAEGAQ